MDWDSSVIWNLDFTATFYLAFLLSVFLYLKERRGILVITK